MYIKYTDTHKHTHTLCGTVFNIKSFWVVAHAHMFYKHTHATHTKPKNTFDILIDSFSKKRSENNYHLWNFSKLTIYIYIYIPIRERIVATTNIILSHYST